MAIIKFISTIQTELRVTFQPRQWLRERVTMSRYAFVWALNKKGWYIKPPKFVPTQRAHLYSPHPNSALPLNGTPPS